MQLLLSVILGMSVFSRFVKLILIFACSPSILKPMDESPDGVEEFMPLDTKDEAINSNKLSLFHIGEQEEAEFDEDLPTLQLRQHEESEFAGPSSEVQDLEMNHAGSFSVAHIPTMPTFYPALLPAPLTLWPPNVANVEETSTAHEVLKPTPLNGKEGIKADEIVSMSKLSIGEGSSGSMEPSALSLQLTGSTNTRQSAFHVNPSMTRTDLGNGNNSPIHAV